jgi:hypothetical protein
VTDVTNADRAAWWDRSGGAGRAGPHGEEGEKAMRRFMRGRAGMVVAFMLGILIAGAGSATAARLISGKQIRDGSITSRDLSKGLRNQLAQIKGPAGGDLTGRYPNPSIAANAVNGEKIAPDSVTGEDIRESTLQGVMAGATRIVTANGAAPDGSTPSATATCAATEKAIAGGAAFIITGFQDDNQVSQLAGLLVTGSRPQFAVGDPSLATGWEGYGRNNSGTTRTLRVYAVCVPRAIP